MPKFKSEQEEARFWDTHGPLDFPDKLAEIKEPFEFSPTLFKNVAKKQRERKRRKKSKPSL